MKLKEIRHQTNLSQNAFAKQFGLSQATYNNYENEFTQPPLEILFKIADYYNVSLDYLCEHKTQHQQELGYLDEQTIEILKLTQELTFENKIKLLSYIAGMVAAQ